MDSALKLDILCAGYSDRTVLRNVSFNVPRGSFCALAGPNGSGKSTLLKCITGELAPFSGNVSVMGRNVKAYSRKELSETLAFVAQNTFFPYEFTVREIVSMGRYCHGDMRRGVSFVDQAIERVGICDIADSLATRISGGEMQLAMLARAICQDTEILVLDEPLSNLDLKYQLRILSILREYEDSGRTVLCVMHDINLARLWCGMCVLIKDGNVISCGKPSDVLSLSNICSVYGIPSDSLSENTCHLSPFKIDSES